MENPASIFPIQLQPRVRNFSEWSLHCDCGEEEVAAVAVAVVVAAAVDAVAAAAE